VFSPCLEGGGSGVIPLTSAPHPTWFLTSTSIL